MRIFILSDANSVHTKRWVASLYKNGVEIYLFSFRDDLDNYYSSFSNLVFWGCHIRSQEIFIKKARYLTFLGVLKRKICDFAPDILHAHYASSYGLLGSLTNFHPYVVSVWGSDVFDFPINSFFNKIILKYVFRKADRVLSTSHVMAKEIAKYASGIVDITPFGVDTTLFKKIAKCEKENKIIVGNVKSLSKVYGIDILIKAFSIVYKNNTNLNLFLEIVGEGPLRKELKLLAKTLGIADKVLFIGKVENDKLPIYYNHFSVAVFPSLEESFGVAVIEAMACECPVITSDAVGFTEVVQNNITGFIVPKYDSEGIAKKIQEIIDSPELGKKLGECGRKRVLELYDWRDNVKIMMEIYQKLLK